MQMKIVDRATFLALPANTVYAKYEPCCFGQLCIKGESVGKNDFYEQEITDAIACTSSSEFMDLLDDAENTGSSVAMDFHCEGRDGLYDDDQLFAVWEQDDVSGLIARLSECINK